MGCNASLRTTNHLQLRLWRRVAFIPFITAGDPDLDTTAEALLRLDAAGATVIELGVPYSVRCKFVTFL